MATKRKQVGLAVPPSKSESLGGPDLVRTNVKWRQGRDGEAYERLRQMSESDRAEWVRQMVRVGLTFHAVQHSRGAPPTVVPTSFNQEQAIDRTAPAPRVPSPNPAAPPNGTGLDLSQFDDVSGHLEFVDQPGFAGAAA